MALLRWSVQQLFLLVTVCGLFAGVIKSANDKPADLAANLQFSPHGKFLLVSGMRTVMWDLSRTTPTRQTIPAIGYFISGPAFVTNEQLLTIDASSTEPGLHFVALDWRTGKKTKLRTLPNDEQFPFLYSRFGYKDGHLLIRNEHGEERRIAMPFSGVIMSGVASADGRRFAFHINQATGFATEVWDAEQTKRLLSISAIPNFIQLSPDGSVFVSGTEDLTIFTEVETGRHVNTLRQETDAGDFFPDGRRYFSWGNSLIVYDTVTGRELLRRRDDEVLGPHRSH